MVVHTETRPGHAVRRIVTDGERSASGAFSTYDVLIGSTPAEEFLIGSVEFQDGPIKDGKGHNGMHHEDLLRIMIHRIDAWQAGPFACQENAVTRQHLVSALAEIEKRTRTRLELGVEGTHTA